MIELYIGTKAEKYLKGELTTTPAPTTTTEEPSTTTSTTTPEVTQAPSKAPSDSTTQDAVE